MSAPVALPLQKGSVHALPILHNRMEFASAVRQTFLELQPDCVAVELPETIAPQALHAASRLPDISVIVTYSQQHEPLFTMVEPCDPAFEGLRSALEADCQAFCIDLDVDGYPEIHEDFPDPYAIQRIGLASYYDAYRQIILNRKPLITDQDRARELYMAKRLKELSYSYDRILYIAGMSHVQRVLDLIDEERFTTEPHAERDVVQLCTLTEESCQEVMGECGYFTLDYEARRETRPFTPPDRQQLLMNLYKAAIPPYEKETHSAFPGYHLRNLMKYCRNYALVKGQLLPNLYQLISVSKGCVDHNYAYHVWERATDYPLRKNIDGLEELDLSVEDVWGHSKIIRFHRREHRDKSRWQQRRDKAKKDYRFQPTGSFSICSFQPEDIVIENFGRFLQKKGQSIMLEQGARTVPYSSSLEDGVDVRETIRHWMEKKLYVKIFGRPQSSVGSVVVVFDPDEPTESGIRHEQFPWKTTWLGEHEQESDMAFYASPMGENVVGPGICRCKYGGFLMSYPPRRMYDVWQDPDYADCRSKSEVLLMAGIDYAVHPLVVYVASEAPRRWFKSFASRFGKKIVYVPIGQLSPVLMDKIRTFHVLDGQDRRGIADEYIF